MRRGIWSVEIPLRGNTLGYMCIDHSGLDDDQPVGDVDIENAVHARQADNDAARCGQRAATQARACAATDKGNFVPGTEADHRLHLLGRARQHHCFRHHAEIRQPVALISLQLAGAGDQPVHTDGGAQPCDLAGGQHSRNSLLEECRSWLAILAPAFKLAVAQA
jgi:hypothetical protein